tara:strand:+ start:1648 stop:2784 length:1137 start_codon:yes stop_codon:yes gene_type:complete
MAFNLGAFVGGASRQLVADIEREEDYALKMKQISETEAMRQRSARASERRKKKIITEETMGMLTALGYSPENAASITKQGNTAASWWIDNGTEAVKKGMDPNTLGNFPAMSGSFDSDDQKTFSETVASGAVAKPAEVAGISADVSVESDTSVIVSDGFSINPQAMTRLYGAPEKVESSFSARLAVLSQNLARKPNDSKVEQWKSEQTKLLNDLRTMKENEREESGAVTPSFDTGTITSHVNEIRRGALNRYGFEVGIDGAISNMTDGNRHLSDIAELNVAGQLSQRNNGIDDPNMNNTADGIRNAAIDNMTDYAYDIYQNKKDSNLLITVGTDKEFEDGVNNNSYRAGQVIVSDGLIIMYTGVRDYRTGNKFIVLSGD